MTVCDPEIMNERQRADSSKAESSIWVLKIDDIIQVISIMFSRENMILGVGSSNVSRKQMIFLVDDMGPNSLMKIRNAPYPYMLL